MSTKHTEQSDSVVSAQDAAADQDEHEEEHQDASSPPAHSLEDLQQQLAQAQQQASEYLQRLQRSTADYQNLKKQTEEEKRSFAKIANASLLITFLDVLDDVERMVANTPDEIAETEWYKGVTLVHQNFHKKLEQEGLQRIKTIGELFDPECHEALLYQAAEDTPPDHIVSEVRAGYRYGTDRILRHAQVVVSKGAE